MDMQYIESAIMANEDKVALKYKVRVKNSGYFGFHMQMPNYTMKATLKNSAGKSITLRDRTKGKLIFCRSTKEIKPGTYYATVTVTRVSASKSKYLGDVFHLDLGNWYTIRDLWEVDE